MAEVTGSNPVLRTIFFPAQSISSGPFIDGLFSWRRADELDHMEAGWLDLGFIGKL